MLAQWMLRRHLEPVRADCRVERSDAVALAAVCAMEMRGWYLDHLAKGPAELLAPEDVAGESEAEAAADGYSVDVWLPERVVRPLSVRLAGWQRSAVVIGADAPGARHCASRFGAGGIAEPVAVLEPDGRLRLFSRPSTRRAPVIESLMAAVDTGEERYRFDERALSLIKPL